MVRAAMTFALYKQGHVNYLARLIDFAGSEDAAAAAPGLLHRAWLFGRVARGDTPEGA